MASIRNEDLTYNSPGNTTRNRFDLYTSNFGIRVGAPTILDLHGGGYTTGDKGLDQGVCFLLADQGYNVCSMNYTLAVVGGTSSFPQTFRDVRAMIAWIRTTGVSMGLSPTIIVIGQSAGATIGVAAAYAPETPEFNPPIPDPPGGYRVDAVVGMFGRYDLVWDAQTYGSPFSIQAYLGMTITAPGGLSRYAAAAAKTYVQECTPPTKLIVGDRDGVVPPGNTYRLSQALSAAGVLNIQQIVVGADHGTGPLGNAAFLANAITADLPMLLAASSPACGLTPPVNDNCADAITIVPDTLVTASSTSATTDATSPCGFGDTKDVWFRFVPPATMRFVFDTFETTAIGDTTLTAFSGCGPEATVLDCNNNSGDGGLSSLTLTLIAGQQVLFRVAGNNGASGIVRLRADAGVYIPPPPVNDTCTTAAVAQVGSTLGTTISAWGETPGPCCVDDTRDVWFLFDAPEAAPYRFDTFGSFGLPDTTLALFASCGGPSIACNDNTNSHEPAATVSTSMLAGQRVLIRVAAPYELEGSFVLNITQLPPEGQGACCENDVCTMTNADGCAAGSFYLAVACGSGSCSSQSFGSCCQGLDCTLVASSAECSGTFHGANLPCGTSSNPIACCPANFNGSGGVSVQDIFDFLRAYFAGGPAADFNANGAISVQDVFDFLNAYFIGC